MSLCHEYLLITWQFTGLEQREEKLSLFTKICSHWSMSELVREKRQFYSQKGEKKGRKEKTVISITPLCVITSNSHHPGAMKASLWTVSGEVTFSRGADERNPLHGLAFKLGHCVPIWWGVVKPRNVAADMAFFVLFFVCVRVCVLDLSCSIYCIIFLHNNRSVISKMLLTQLLWLNTD